MQDPRSMQPVAKSTQDPPPPPLRTEITNSLVDLGLGMMPAKSVLYGYYNAQFMIEVTPLESIESTIIRGWFPPWSEG